jgi:iron complex outermembrane receptor protein
MNWLESDANTSKEIWKVIHADPHKAETQTLSPLISHNPQRVILLLCAWLVLMPGSASGEERENPVTELELPEVEVIGTTPLPALGTPLEKVPANVRSLTAEEFEDQNPTDLSEMLFRNVPSIHLNAAQNNPFQNDITYRGFLASPLLGSAIGLSVYLDGARFNEGFGDTVNWDLIPQSAISSIDLIPGSNPLFGLNTLGGALAVRTKSGFAFQGTEVEASGGSFGRWAVEAEHGGYRDKVDWYLTFNALDEDGWRVESPSEIRQLFGKLGWENDTTDLDLSYIFADNALTGNGVAPESLLARDREAVHTFPDDTENRMHFINLRASHWIGESLLVAGNAFYRDYERATLNGDAEVVCADEATDATIFSDPQGERPLHLGLCEGPAAPFFDAEGNPGLGELEGEVEGEDRTTQTETDTWGIALQLTHEGKFFGRGNTATLGFSYDRSRTDFRQEEAESEIFERGLSRGTQRTAPFEIAVDIDTTQENWGFYVTDTVDITEQLALTFAGRYQMTDIEIRDQTGAEENTDLNGKHDFDRFNPAVGITYSYSKALNLFGGYSEGFRAPTPAELTCADPGDPCNLPNAFLADPPLDPVIGRTWEAGARGELPWGEKSRWSVAYFRTTLKDDLVFSATETGGAGFFTNAEETRRQGVEFGLLGRAGPVDWFTGYSFIAATYESAETLASVVDPGGIAVEEGDCLPGIPEHNLKLGLEWAATGYFWLGGNLVYASDQFLRGDDSNEFDTVDDYVVVNLHTRVAFGKHAELWARVDNVFDADYETGGIRNFNAFADPIDEERFLAPGAPRAGWVGVKLRF